MRSTEDLIEEMQAAAPQLLLVAIVVGFEKESISVFASEDSPLKTLNDLVRKGGIPLGLIGARKDDEQKTLSMLYRVYPEHSGEAAVMATHVLQTILEFVATNLSATSGASVVNFKNEWIN